MHQPDDAQLLQAYAQDCSHDAFGEIVRRHVDLVYSAAARRVRDRHAAEDVTQVVFLVLARKAPRLRRVRVLSAWLLGVTRLAANDWLKSDARRRRREQAAARERSEIMADAPPPPPAESPLAPLLDDAMAKLSAPSREALALRFFEGRTFREVGDRLGISEDAAKHRVARGLDRLRAALGRAGATTTAESLALSLGATAVLPAPAGLSASVAATAAGSAAAAPYAAMAKGVTSLMAWTKAKTVAAGLAAALLVGGGGVAVVRFAADDDSVAPPFGVAVISGTAGVASDASALSASPVQAWHGPLTGVARTQAGKPLAGATVELVPMNRTVLLYGKTPDVATTTTGPDGSFSFTPTQEPAAVIVRSPEFVGIGVAKSPGTLVEVTARKWGRLEGTVTAGGKPVPNADLFLWQPVEGQDVEKSRWVDRNIYLRSDAQGRVSAERVLPGDTRIDLRQNGAIHRAYKFSVAPGETTVAAIGQAGRGLVGRVTPALPAANHRSGYLSLQQVADGRSYLHSFSVAPDGTFAVSDVPPGNYTLSVRLAEAEPGGKIVAHMARGSLPVTIPPVSATGPGAPVDGKPFDAGAVPLTVLEGFFVGSPVPPMTGRTLDGAPISLADFRGKYVLLHLSPPQLADDPAVLKVIHDRFADPRLAMVTAFLDKPDRALLSLLGQGANRPDWPQIVPAQASPLSQSLATSPHRLLLIDPEGKLVARALPDPSALDSLPRALKPLDGGRLATAGATVVVDHVPPGKASADQAFEKVPPPAADDAATRATFEVVDGEVWEKNGAGGLRRLVDGKTQPTDDAPPDSAFFQWGSLEGRIKMDLGRRVDVAAINTYSWHKNDRAPQVYNVFASDGTAANFVASPKNGTDPCRHGWRKLAAVDTRPSLADGEEPGGRYGVSITGPSGGSLGSFRYLLLQVFVTETRDEWGLTFFGELDVIEQR